LAYLENPVNKSGITPGLSTGHGFISKLSYSNFESAGVFHTWFDGHQVVEIKVENTLFHIG
jgi:hypothetical protein